MMKKLLLCLALLAIAPALRAGEAAEEFMPIPGRIAKVAVGDWVEFKLGDAGFRHRAEKVERGPEGAVVHFVTETLDASGKAVREEPATMTEAKELEISRRYMEAFDKRGAIGYSDSVLIGDKPVNAVIFIDGGTEFWFSDQLGVLNLIRFDPGDGDNSKRRYSVEFGTAANAPPRAEKQ